jgi:hypothetical protein
MDLLSLVVSLTIAATHQLAIDERPSWSLRSHGKVVNLLEGRGVRDDSPLNPDRVLYDPERRVDTLYGVSRVDIVGGETSLHGQARGVGRATATDSSGRGILDEAYLERAAGTTYWYMGKKNVRRGAALFANPTEFLYWKADTGPATTYEDQKYEREGVWLGGGDILYRNLTLTVRYLPNVAGSLSDHERFEAYGALFLDEANVDIAVVLMTGETSAAGVNVTAGIGESLVLYFEGASRNDLRRRLLTVVETGDGPVYAPEERLVDGYRPVVVAGGHYTWDDGTNLIVEYLHDGFGYDAAEWKTILDARDRGAALRGDPTTYEAGVRLGGMALDAITFDRSRQNYLTLRLWRPIPPVSAELSLVGIYSLDDAGYLFRPYLSAALGSGYSVGLVGTVFGGPHDSEYGMAHWRYDLSLEAIFRF